MNFLKRSWPILIIILAVTFFFQLFFLKGKFPIPADTIIGLYHPFRDLYANEYPRGIPYKNFLITDPVRQQYPWRELSMDLIKKGELPLWNPYAMAGYPLIGNLQAGVFYPLNVVFFVLPFSLAWSILIVLAPLMAGIFLYFYLNNLKISKWASLLGSITFAFSGFSVAWLEWGTILHAGLWLPLILLAIDKAVLNLQGQSERLKVKSEKLQFKIKNYLWLGVFVFTLVSSFFAGHLQVFFYVFILSAFYMFARWIQFGRNFTFLYVFLLFYILFFILTSIQWIPTLQLIIESARNIDQADWTKEGWFIPWQHLIQFVAPDFFGNPTTLNYWGAWNYGEFIGYIGLLPLIMALFAMVARRDKKTYFFTSTLILSIVFALPTFLAQVPYMLTIPFISTAQPTRLLYISDFSLVVLSALGFDFFLRQRSKIWYPIVFVGLVLIGLWLFVFLGKDMVSEENLSVANKNLLLPTLLAFAIAGLIFAYAQFSKVRIAIIIIYIIIVVVSAFDLLRFGLKFTPFANKEYLFPSTKAIEFLKNQGGIFRVMTTDSRIFPPNFSTVYRLQSVDGYDPLYLRRYGELIAASERGKPDISPPFGFNRIITPKNFDSKLIDLLGVKYVLSLSDLESPKLTKVFQEVQTRVYENKNALPRAFFVEEVAVAQDKNEAIQVMFAKEFNLARKAVIEKTKGGESVPPLRWNVGKIEFISYSENKVVIKTENAGNGFLVLTDSFYPTWRAYIDGQKTLIYRTDYNFRGIVVPKGEHRIEFSNRLL